MVSTRTPRDLDAISYSFFHFPFGDPRNHHLRLPRSPAFSRARFTSSIHHVIGVNLVVRAHLYLFIFLTTPTYNRRLLPFTRIRFNASI